MKGSRGRWLAVASLASAAGALTVGWGAGCSGSSGNLIGNGNGSGPGGLGDGATPVAQCTPCSSSATCGGGACALIAGDTFCASGCTAGTTGEGAGSCPAGTTCTLTALFDGTTANVCVPGANVCIPGWMGSGSGSGTGLGTGTGIGSSGTGSASGTGVGPTLGDAGPPPSGTVGLTGGTVSRLYFASTGDTRPSLPPLGTDPLSGYPTAIIEQIFTEIASLSPPPTFVVTTGDYQLALTGSGGAAQFGAYMMARAKYPGTVFFGMGNHECSTVGVTTSNCGSGNAQGVSATYSAFLSTMLAPIQQTLPYYVIKVNATDGSWTSKFVFVAANAWDSTQSAWLTTAMGEATTYTFVIRHEPNDATTAPGTTPSEAIITQFPVTLEICGHTHNYSHTGNRVVLGNGGAPLTGSGDYGFGTFAQRADGAIVVDEVNYKTGATDPAFHFVVTPAGAITM